MENILKIMHKEERLKHEEQPTIKQAFILYTNKSELDYYTQNSSLPTYLKNYDFVGY